MGKYVLAGAVVITALYAAWLPSLDPAPIQAASSQEVSDTPEAGLDITSGTPSEAITRQEAKVFSSAAVGESRTMELPAVNRLLPEYDADAIPLASQRQPQALGPDLDAEASLGLPQKVQKALGPDLDPEDISAVVARQPQRLGADIDVETYEAMGSTREPQSLGDDIDVGSQNPQ